MSDKLPKLMETIKKDWQMIMREKKRNTVRVFVLLVDAHERTGMCEPEPITRIYPIKYRYRNNTYLNESFETIENHYVSGCIETLSLSVLVLLDGACRFAFVFVVNRER